MADSEIINVFRKVKSFSAAPKFSGYDMVVLNVSDDMYISSPYATVDERKLDSRANGMHTFVFVEERNLWQYNGGSFITVEDLDTLYGIKVEYFSDSEFTDKAKDGDTVSVSKFTSEDSTNGESTTVTFEFTRSGTKLEALCPLVHPDMRQQVANNLLKRMYGIEYQPMNAGGAIVNPAAELGDGIQTYGHYSGIFRQKITFTSLMSSDVSAPGQEETESEFPYENEQNREFKRKLATVSATFSILADRITAEVAELTGRFEEYDTKLTQTSRAIALEAEAREQADTDLYDGLYEEILDTSNPNSLKSELRVEAGKISAKVDKQGGNSGSFGWTLTDSSWTLQSSGRTVFTANSSGIDVKGSGEFSGTITASGGTIGGFTIGRNAIYNGIEAFTDTETSSGVYLGTNGIKLGQTFQVTSSGAVTAGNLRLTGGRITMGDDGNGNPLFQVTNAGAMTMKNGSITLGDDGNGNPVFRVTNTGAVTASNLRLTGGNITMGDDGSGNAVFRVSNSGAVTASSMNITGGSISIGSNFRVDSNGNLYATSGTFTGRVSAGQIQYGGDYGTLNGNGLTPSTLNADSLLQGNTLTGDGGIIKPGSISGTATGGALGATAVKGIGGGVKAIGAFDNNDLVSYINASTGAFNKCGAGTGSFRKLIVNNLEYKNTNLSFVKSVSGSLVWGYPNYISFTVDGNTYSVPNITNVNINATSGSWNVLGYNY